MMDLRRIELADSASEDLPEFYAAAFGWKRAARSATAVGVRAGPVLLVFRLGRKPVAGGPLPLIEVADLLRVQAAVVAAGGQVDPVEITAGGRRFEFTDPAGNRLAVWSKHG